MADSKRVRISKREGALVRMIVDVMFSSPPQLGDSAWFPSLLNLASINATGVQGAGNSQYRRLGRVLRRQHTRRFVCSIVDVYITVTYSSSFSGGQSLPS